MGGSVVVLVVVLVVLVVVLVFVLMVVLLVVLVLVMASILRPFAAILVPKGFIRALNGTVWVS